MVHNYLTFEHRNVLIEAICNGHQSIVKILIEAGISPKGYYGTKDFLKSLPNNFDHKSPLMYVAEKGDFCMLSYFIELGVQVFPWRDIQGRSALWYAANENHKDCCELLVRTMIGTAPKERVCTFLNCLKRLYPNEYSVLHNAFKKYLQEMLSQKGPRDKKECKTPYDVYGPAQEIVRTNNRFMKKHLFAKYFQGFDFKLYFGNLDYIGINCSECE